MLLSMRQTGRESISVVAAPLRKQVSALLRTAVVSGEIQPGLRLVEGELSTRFGVSRTVIREALRHLEAEGLVQMIANRGAIVRRLSQNDGVELFEVREAIESVAAGYCAERATQTQRVAVAEAFDRLVEAYSTGVLSEMLPAKEAFYQALMTGSGNDALAAVGKIIHGRGQMMCGETLQIPGRVQASVRELKAVVVAVIAGDGTAARRSAVEHVHRARDAWTSLHHEPF